MITNTDLAYAAGYIDGDGCFHISKQSNKFITHFLITSTDKNILMWFRKKFEGTISHPKANKNPSHKTVYYFSQKKKRAVPFAESILPYLVEKRFEATIFIDFSKSKDFKNRVICIGEMETVKNLTNLIHKDHKFIFETCRNTITPTEQDFSYLAGFIDAECCLGIQKYRDKRKPNYLYKIQLQCNNTKAPIFKWLLQRFGGQVHFIDRNSKDSSQRNQLTWRLSSSALAQILSKIHPFLKHKKPVCEELMKFTKTITDNRLGRNTEKSRESYSKIIEEREAIVSKVHLLNLKGINI